MREGRIAPGPGQESVWDYPRPPRLERCDALIEIFINDGEKMAESRDSFRILETSHPPVYYLPPKSIRMDWLVESNHGSFCEWKGYATYYSLQLGDRLVPNVAWCYKLPSPRFSEIAGYLAFYPSKMDACYVDGERVRAQDGDFYGGWITQRIVGPFKGGPGTLGW
jgi:uncharacterized protein (DUF427 family)